MPNQTNNRSDAPLPKDVRAAREFLRKRGVRGLPPRMFARSAIEAGVDYKTLLDKLAGVARRQLK